MRIEAATLAGGELNQDYYAYGETYALVLDGASSFLPEKTSIDAATYVKALGETLAEKLECCHLDEVPGVVTESIGDVTKKYDLVENSAPSSTVVIAKWNQRQIVTYVLGDSYCVVDDGSGKRTLVTDDRITQLGASLRETYRRRQAAGSGFDSAHRMLLRQIQMVQKQYRNSDEGYWIAAAVPEAGVKGISFRFDLKEVRSVILASDGGFSSIRDEEAVTLLHAGKNKVYEILESAQKREQQDQRGQKVPRSKVHDDKTVVLIML